MDAGNSWGELQLALNGRVAELKRYTHLRLEDRCKHQHDQDLLGLDASVHALEKQLAELKARLKSEAETVPKVESMIRASVLQGADLQHLASNLPAHLPANQRPASHASGAQLSINGTGTQQSRHAKSEQQPSMQGDGHDAHAPMDQRRKRENTTCPRWFVTEVELNQVSSYMRGRLTLEKVNTVLNELAGFAEANNRLMASLKQSGARMSGADRKRATELLHTVAMRDGVRGRFWFLESELRDGVSIKADKSGKALLTLLRHLRRMDEVRIQIEGTCTLVHVLTSSS